MSRKFFPDSDDSGSDFDEATTDLPFPKPLSQESFLASDFDPAIFLASLTDRHQTLEDLRLELRELSQRLNKELLDLVNENYQDFLSLGDALRGGEEKVEEVRVGLLGFQRDISSIQAKVDARKNEMQSLLQEKKSYRVKRNIGRTLLDIAERMEELEQRLMIANSSELNIVHEPSSDTDPESEAFSSESSDEDGELEDEGGESTIISLRRLEKNVQRYVYILEQTQRTGPNHPFLASQEPRLTKIKSTILLDLDTAFQQAKKSGHKGEARVNKIQRLYNLLDAETHSENAKQQLST